MNNEDCFRLMELMIKMGFDSKIIMATLFHCSSGQSIGYAYVLAKIDVCDQEKKPNE